MRTVEAHAFLGGKHGYQALPDDSRGCCYPIRTRLSAASCPGILLFQRLRGATRRPGFAVLWCSGLGVGLIVWFARDFRDWHAVRSVLIASVVGLAANVTINAWGTVQGWLNANAWGTTVVLLLLLLGGVYQLSTGARKTA
jgi:hypothetical protein